MCYVCHTRYKNNLNEMFLKIRRTRENSCHLGSRVDEVYFFFCSGLDNGRHVTMASSTFYIIDSL
jgi:hypothetical protein